MLPSQLKTATTLRYKYAQHTVKKLLLIWIKLVREWITRTFCNLRWHLFLLERAFDVWEEPLVLNFVMSLAKKNMIIIIATLHARTNMLIYRLWNLLLTRCIGRIGKLRQFVSYHCHCIWIVGGRSRRWRRSSAWRIHCWCRLWSCSYHRHPNKNVNGVFLSLKTIFFKYCLCTNKSLNWLFFDFYFV